MRNKWPRLKQARHTSTQGEDVLDAEFLGPGQVCRDFVLRHLAAGDVKHGLHAAVVQHGTGNGHRTGRLVRPRVTCSVPRDVTEQRLTLAQAVNSVNTQCLLEIQMYNN